jgi:hypothetical protein
MGFSYNVGKSVGALSVALVGVTAEHIGLLSSIALYCFVGYSFALLALALLPETRGRDLANITPGDDLYGQAPLMEQASPSRR